MTTESVGFEDAVGRQRSERDEMTLFPARGMRALLDCDPEEMALGGVLPWGWHWLYFKPVVPQSELDEDGHPRRTGGFLPGGPLGRRMWAGGVLRFFEPLRLGDAVERVSTIKSVTEKAGWSGKLVFVTVGHRVSGPSGLACDEDQQLVYRGASGGSGSSGGTPPKGTPLDGEPEWEGDVSAHEHRPLPLFGVHVQRPPHPLRPSLRHRARRVPGAGRARTASRAPPPRCRDPPHARAGPRRLDVPGPRAGLR